ncbi:MAG: glycosyl hydrolase, partial [Verrucomicrobiota bacterium]
WKGYMQTVLDRLGPVASKTLEGALIDSYEVGGQNWTPQFREEFQRRRGYDLLKYLPALTGRVVDNPEISERFLWDMRRTIADLFAENYYGRFQELCHQHGLVAMTEPYTGPFESLQCGGAADLPMGEFWIDMKPLPAVKLASSVGHIYGKPVIGTESFTAAPGMRHARWQTDPYSLKTLGDLVFSQGINRFILHRFVMQPWTNRWPGMTMGKWGTEFDRTTTWWEPGRAWHEYVARCQYLLQQGRFVAEAAYYSGESVPVEMRAGDPALPEGFDYDGINADVLLHQAKVRDGQLVLKSGMRYRVLILPPKDPAMTPRVLRQLRTFVADGLTIVGAPPPASPSLENYPRCDVEVRKIAAELWGNCDGQTITEHAFGKGKVVWGQSLEKVLAGLSVKPDFSYDQSQRSKLVFIHRLDRSADIYFVANQRQRFESLECSFRVSGKTPELWNAQTGQIEKAPVWRQENDRTIVPLRFDPAGSVFVVFREKAKGDHVVSVKVEGPAEQPAPARIPELRIVKALYGAFPDGGAVTNFQRTVDVTAKVAERIQNDALEVWANDQLGGNPAGNLAKELRIEYSLDGVRHEIANAQDQLIVLPDTAPPMGTPPAYRVYLDAEGKPRVWTSKPGTFTLTMASGRRLELRCDAVPAPVQISGPWDVRFPAGWNAPEQMAFERLESWTKSSNDGVKYFSGTAVYEKQLNVPGELMGSGRQMWLDLGGVKNLAEVFLNEQPLGILWKPPFRVNVSGVLKTGKNVLRIKVTNLWPNRLIGDEQLPPDCEWDGEGLKATDGKKLKAWPQWFLQGKPSPTGRVTFATWHHWTKDDPLLESGLLGPVRLEASEELGARK